MKLRSDFTIRAVTPETETPEAAAGEKFSVQRFTTLVGPEEMQIRLPGDRARGGRREGETDGVRRVAMLVTHGMGQQVPFETLSALGQALITQHAARHKLAGPLTELETSVKRVKLTEDKDAPELSRVEVKLKDEKGSPVEVHLYESYWAPFTEGQISFLQTVAFLYTAGWNGIRTYLRSEHGRDENGKRQERRFDRWIFGKFHEMPIKHGTFWALLLIVASVTLLLLPSFLVFTPAGISTLEWLWKTYKAHLLAGPHWLQAVVVVGAILLAALAWWVHYFVVEFAGDVAIYVSSYKVSRYDAIRNKILETVCTITKQIYSAGIVDDQQAAAYDSVVIVGHSLGSVISYDALNAAINWDEVECGSENRVVERTTRLITFGSPLDKTAFLFRTQVSSARNLREALAARQQPLILDYERYRREGFQWVNLYSKRDIVSGHLDYYDAAGLPGYNPVINRVDPQAWKPLLAHTQYWDNDALQDALYEAVWAVPVRV